MVFARNASTSSRNSKEYKLWTPASRFTHTKRYVHSFCSRRKRKSISIQIHAQERRQSTFWNFLGQMHPVEFEIKDTPESKTFVYYLLWSIGMDGHFHTFLYDDFSFQITNFPVSISDIPSSAAHGVFISQHKWYERTRSTHQCIITRVMRLFNELL